MNMVLLLGTLTQDAVQNTLPSGVLGALLHVEVIKNFGERQEVSIVEVKAWTKVAELALQRCKKGVHVLIEGRVKVDTWTAKDTGKQFSKINIVAENITFTAEEQRDVVAYKDEQLQAHMLSEAKRISPQQEAYNRNLEREFAPQPQKNITSNLLDSGELPF